MSLLSFRLSCFYITIFFVIGIMMPFWPVWLEARGMTAIEIGILTAIPVIGKLFFSPIFASLGDKLGERKRLMLFFIGLSFVFFALHNVAYGFIALFIISLLYGMSWSPIMSFGDNITLLSTQNTKIQYGRLRLWGSLSFILMSAGFGFFLERSDESLIFWSILIAIALTFLATSFLPNVRAAKLGKSGKPVRALLKQRSFQLFMATVACIHGSHALYYAFATIHWRSLGYSDTLIGFLWGIGVVAEVIFFIFGGRIGKRFSATDLLFLAAIAGIIRWSVIALNPDLEILIAVQTLHAFTFGAMHLGAMMFMSRAVSLEFSTTAQSLYGASAFGFGAGTTLLFSGFLYNQLGALAFFVMTLICLGGTIFTLALRRHQNRSFAALRTSP